MYDAETLGELLAQSAARWGERPAVALDADPAGAWSYGYLATVVGKAATYLRSAGVEKGDRVAIWGANRPEWVAAFFAIQLAGAIALPLDAGFVDAAVAVPARPKHLFLGREQAERLGSVPADATPLDGLAERVAACAPLPPNEVAVAPDDLAELAFTSGTTATPKLVMLSHRNLMANVRAGRTAFPPTPQSRVLSLLPLSHLFEQAGGLFVPLSGGASVVYPTSLRPDSVIAALARNQITNMTCVPQVLDLFRRAILREAQRRGRARQLARVHAIAARLPFGLRRLLFRGIHRRLGGAFAYFVVGGAYLSPELARWWEGLGIKVAQGYGLTEAAPVVATNALDDRDPESVGRPPQGVQVRIADDGEILVRGDNVTRGYWENPTATGVAFENGWFKTGDLGAFDRAGRLHLRGRKKNLIVLANGTKLSPEDLEHVLLADERVKDAVVLGRSSGQDVTVHAVLVTDRPDEARAIVRAANARLAPQQQIRDCSVWSEPSFPLTPTLKAKRDEIAAWLQAERGIADASAPAAPGRN